MNPLAKFEITLIETLLEKKSNKLTPKNVEILKAKSKSIKSSIEAGLALFAINRVIKRIKILTIIEITE